MDPQITDVFDGVRSIIDDNLIAGGEVFTNDILQRPFALAYRELYDAMLANGVKYVEQLAYYSLPAYTTMLSPAQIGITNFGEPVRLRERGATADIAITAVSVVGNGLQVTTSTPHGLSQNQEVTVWGVLGQLGANGRFFVDLVDATHAVLKGAASVGAYTSGGTLTYGGDQFSPMTRVNDNLPQGVPGIDLQYWLWRGDRFLFQGAASTRELEIVFTVSGDAPTSGTVGVDDSLNFLIFSTAKHAIVGREPYQALVPYLNTQSATTLANFIQIVVRSMPGRRSQPFRNRFRRIGV
jgi:hypothetical protein